MGASSPTADLLDQAFDAVGDPDAIADELIKAEAAAVAASVEIPADGREYAGLCYWCKQPSPIGDSRPEDHTADCRMQDTIAARSAAG